MNKRKDPPPLYEDPPTLVSAEEARRRLSDPKNDGKSMGEIFPEVVREMRLERIRAIVIKWYYPVVLTAFAIFTVWIFSR